MNSVRLALILIAVPLAATAPRTELRRLVEKWSAQRPMSLTPGC